MTMTALASPIQTRSRRRGLIDANATQSSTARQRQSESHLSSLRDLVVAFAVFVPMALGAVAMKACIWLPIFAH
jgi:hypothetical protein